MSAYWKIPLQVIVLLVGVLVFVFYTFNPGPLIFSAAAESAPPRRARPPDAYRALETEFQSRVHGAATGRHRPRELRAHADDAARVSAAQTAVREP